MYKSETNLYNGFEAKVVEDSINLNGVRLITMQLRYPRFIHAEFMTHRVFSRNASSSRAIPVHKLIKQVQVSPAMPIHWGMNQPGMQAEEECDVPVKHGMTEETREEHWKRAAFSASEYAHDFMSAGYHKQIVNRLTEPFQFINVVVTATEWDNFFKLRLDAAAQPEIRKLAEIMKMSMNSSEPAELYSGDWHLPYVRDKELDDYDLNVAQKLSVARCARVSYLNHDQSDPDVEKDVALHDMLLKAGHMSPFEHIATPMIMDEPGTTHIGIDGTSWSGNFRDWAQYRQLLGEYNYE